APAPAPRTAGSSALAPGPWGRGLAPPRAPQLAGQGAEPGAHRGDVAPDQLLDGLRPDIHGPRDPGGVMAHGDERAQPPGSAARVEPRAAANRGKRVHGRAAV